MSVSIQIINNAIVCTDTDTDTILISQPSKDIWYKERDLVNERISFYKTNLNSERGADEELPYIELANAVDGGLVAFSIASFRTFMYAK